MALTKVTYSMIEGNVVTPEDFGAIGNGVADDTAAIQAAIDHFTITGQINGGIIYLANNYAISDTLLFYNSSIDFYGQGYGAMQGSAKTYIRWVGTDTAKSMIRIQSSRAVKIRNLRLIGNTDYKPMAAIDFYVDNPGSPTDISQNSFNRIENVWIGAYDGNDLPSPTNSSSDAATGRQFTNGILYDGDNTGNNYDIFTNIRIGRCTNGVNILTNQFGQNQFNGFWVTSCDYGFITNGAPVIGSDWFFDNNTTADIFVGNDGRLDLINYASEASNSMLTCQSGRVYMRGCTFSVSLTTFGGTVADCSTGSLVVLNLDDFTLYNAQGYVGTPTFNFSSGNDYSTKVLTGRNVRGVFPANLNINTSASAQFQQNIVDLQLVNTNALQNVVITDAVGNFSCTATNILIGQPVEISGTFGGTGSIVGYVNSSSYYVVATNGTTTFQLSTAINGAPVTTTAGTPTGLTYTTDGTFLIRNTLGPLAFAAQTVSLSRYDIPTNLNLKKGIYYPINTLAATATPSVANFLLCNTSGTTAITNFTDGTTGQVIIVLAQGNITITNGASIQLSGAANFAMTALDTLTLVQISSNLWRELSRSVN